MSTKPEICQKTVLFDSHVAANARMVEFGGWNMPVMYSNIVSEHLCVREKAGLFDLCHMGRLQISGPEHKDFLHRVITNNVHDLAEGRARYALVLNEEAYPLDDILIYSDNDNETFMVVNAGNREKVLAHLLNEAEGSSTSIKDLSFDLAMIAIQGPLSVEISNELSDDDLSAIPYYGHRQSKVLGQDCRVARTGYTGEDGFEFFMPTDKAVDFWNKLLDAGKDKGLLPIGLGARDTLRLEAGMPLYGHEIDENTTPLEAGLSFALKLKKDPKFIGQDALIKQKSDGLKRVLVGLELKDKRVPRQGYALKKDGETIGSIVSGTASPSLQKNLAHAFIKTEFKDIGTEVKVEIRGKELDAVIINKPFYKRQK